MYHLFKFNTSDRLFTVILPRKNAKDLKDGGRFPKRLSMQCVSKCNVKSISNKSYALLIRYTPKVN